MGSRCWVPEALTKIGMHTASCDSLVGCLGLSWQLSSFRIINDIKQCDGFGHVNGGPDGVQRLTVWNYVDCECCEHSNVCPAVLPIVFDCGPPMRYFDGFTW